MFFLKNNTTGVRNAMSASKAIGNPRSFVPTVSGKVTLAIYSAQGELLFKGLVNVTAGKKYNVGQFARISAVLPLWCLSILDPQG